jgi:carboxypeptidase-like protein
MRVRSIAGIIAIAFSSLPAQAPTTGSAIVVGHTTHRETGDALGYAVISIPSLNRQQFANDRGGFTIRGLPAGPLRIRFKHIGNSPRDTVVTLHDNDTLHLEIALATIVIQLPSVRISGACGDKHPDERAAGILADLFDQVQQNADRYRLLADSNPFVMTIYRVRGSRTNGGKIVATSIDTVLRMPFPPQPYKPRHNVRLAEAELGGRSFYLSVPELADFADTAFTNNHCFTYAGQKRVDGDSVIAVDFEPTPALKDEVDFRGTMYVRAEGYQLVRADLDVNKLSSELRSSGMTAVHVKLTFTEILPGVAVLDRSEADTKLRGGFPTAVELGQVFNVRWVKGPP